MTDSEKLLVIVDKCRDVRRRSVDAAAADLQKNGWAASEVSYHFSRFDLCGDLLTTAGQVDELDWTRDVMGVQR